MAKIVAGECRFPSVHPTLWVQEQRSIVDQNFRYVDGAAGECYALTGPVFVVRVDETQMAATIWTGDRMYDCFLDELKRATV